MNGATHDDPFRWDVSTVVRVLAAPGSPWTKDASSLAALIREEEIDGETLLKYEHIYSLKELMQCLGIRLARHKVALGETLYNMKSKSKAYKQWKHQFDKKEEDPPFDDSPERSSVLDTNPISSLSIPQPGINGPQTTDGPASIPHSGPATQGLGHSEVTIHEAEMEAVGDNSQLAPLEPSTPLEEPESSLHAENNVETGRGVKRKRVAPQTLANKPISVAPAFIPTEADTISLAAEHDRMNAHEFPWEEASSGAYLGDGSLTLQRIRASNGSLSSRLIDISTDSFVTTFPNQLPAGRRLVVYRATKRILQKNSGLEKLAKEGFASMRSPSPGDSESVLDLDDLPDAFDSETLREMEEERQERERHQAHIAQQYLSPEKVKGILDESIQTMTSMWEEKKLPKHQRKAYHLWHTVRGTGKRKSQVLNAHKQAKFFDDRIRRLCTEIMDETWTKPSELKSQANCLEASVQDKLYNQWLANMLESGTEPPKPEPGSRLIKKPIQRREDALDEDILTSSDEDDFVVHDEDPEPNICDAMDVDEERISARETTPQPVKAEYTDEYPDLVDLTQTTWPMTTSTGRKITSFIDLTSPAKPKSPCPRVAVTPESPSRTTIAIPPPTPGEFGSFQEIGERSPKHWAREGDNWRLLICLIWQLPHARRGAMISFLQEHTMEDSWTGAVISHLDDPIESIEQLGKQTDKTVRFDITRIFLCFLRRRYYQEHLPICITLSAGLKDKLLSSQRPWFYLFWAFIRDAASDFPKDNQIYTSNLSEDDLEEDIDDEELQLEEAESQSKSKRLPKEIVQNKEAVDLREREVMRMREQDARRDKLRADFSQLGTMPRDRARLIVNESKDKDHGFIYVNDEIGKRIKDHQLDGVRFMWNQIVLGPEESQGCLLAHTMGLGKTMQVITLLVVLRESATSRDPAVRSQIPKHLRESRTVVVCPPSLVENWVDELLMWAPDGILGQFRRVDAKLVKAERLEAVRKWANDGGVLVIGYNMLGAMLSSEVEDLLLETANIVVADEAHLMKNPTTRANKACSRFKTRNRIALTGSPLANNVEEYHAMLDWVAPNFLGPLEEFRQIYATPIEHGLWRNSDYSQKRTALKRLAMLKTTVAPKVHRATIKTALAEGLLGKAEFVLFVPATPLQARLYDLYVEAMNKRETSEVKTVVFAAAEVLRLICNHPRCFQEKVKEISNTPAKDGEDGVASFPRSIVPQALKELKVPDLISTSLSLKVELLTIILDEAKRIGDKVLVFSQSIPTIHYLQNLFRLQQRRVACLVGNTAIEKRQEMTKNFNNGSQEVYLISTTAGGVGLNIHGANRVVIFDFKWNPVHEQQAIGRAYRIGQKKRVFVYTLIVSGSFEESIHSRRVFKTQLSSRVVDKQNPLSWSKRHEMIMRPLRNKAPKNLNEFKNKDEILDKLIEHNKDGRAIQSVLSTDTFEEEDPADDLTADEHRHVIEMLEENRRRQQDPAGYAREQAKRQEDEYHRLARLSQQVSQPAPSPTPKPKPIRLILHPSKHASSGNPSSDGASRNLTLDERTLAREVSSGTPLQPVPQTQQPSSMVSHANHPTKPLNTEFGPAPLPVTGANTYFGNQALIPQNTDATASASAVPASTQSRKTLRAATRPMPSAPSSGTNLFSQPRSQSKASFQRRLEGRIVELLKRGVLNRDNDFSNIGQELTDEIDAVRKSRGLGFLPDNQRWKELESLLVHDQFVTALVLRLFTSSWAAEADKGELEERIKAMSGLPQQVISARASRRASSPDPHNLQNIERSRAQQEAMSHNPHAREDLEVMREAADNRRRRAKH